jgi:hypothetical protein
MEILLGALIIIGVLDLIVFVMYLSDKWFDEVTTLPLIIIFGGTLLVLLFLLAGAIGHAICSANPNLVPFCSWG